MCMYTSIHLYIYIRVLLVYVYKIVHALVHASTYRCDETAEDEVHKTVEDAVLVALCTTHDGAMR